MNIDWNNEDTVRAFQQFNASLPSSSKIKVIYRDWAGNEEAISLVRKHLVFSPEEARDLSIEGVLSLCSEDQVEIEILLAQPYEIRWAVFCTHHWKSTARLNLISSTAKLASSSTSSKLLRFGEFLDKDFEDDNE